MSFLLTPTQALTRRFELPAQAVPAPRVETQRRYGVAVGKYGLLLPAGVLCEVAETLPDCRLPNTPIWFTGVMNLRGTMVSVFDVDALLDEQIDAMQRRWALVIGTRDEAIGLCVSRLPETLYLSPEDRLTHTPTVHARLEGFVTGTWHYNDSLWFDWRLFEFFSGIGACIQ